MKQTVIQAVIVFLAVILALVVYGAVGSTHAFGASLPTDGTVSRTQGTIYAYSNNANIVPGIWSDGVLAVKTYLQFNAGVNADSAATSTSFVQAASVVTSCAASSTAFVVANPFAATSTVSVELMTGTGQATTTTFSIGTTTKSSGLALADISPSLVSGAVAPTTTQFSLRSGQSTALGSGQITAGSATVRSIVVGPSENIAMFGTSTATGLGAANYSPSLTACSVKLFWNM